jgi:hypothetical protein
MIVIDFDRSALVASRTGNDTWEVTQEVPVRLRIGNVDLLGWESGWPEVWRGPHEDMAGVPVCLTHMAWWGLVALKLAEQRGGSRFWLGMYGDRGELVFWSSGQDIVVHSTPYHTTVQINYRKLEQAWEEFSNQVRQFLLEAFPLLRNQTAYTRWEEPGWQEWLLTGKAELRLPIRLPMTVDLLLPEELRQLSDVEDHTTDRPRGERGSYTDSNKG